jgi:hypothetical protein
MKAEDITPKLLESLSKRARIVVEYIIKHGSVTTEDMEKMGYAHAPRAFRDVREAGIPLKTEMVTGSKGKRMAQYSFDDSAIEKHKLGGRKVFSKDFARALFGQYSNHCAFCNEQYEDRYLQIDHRVPYEVAGETGRIGNEDEPDLFVPVCGTCNRKKSWSCEHCDNWNKGKDADLCKQCYWASPEDYKHIAGHSIRRLEVVWSETEVSQYDGLAKEAKRLHLPVQEFVKRMLAEKK